MISSYLHIRTVVFSLNVFGVSLRCSFRERGFDSRFSCQKSENYIIMKTNLVTIQEAKAVTSSLQIAQTFSKDHKNVLRDIEKLECSQEFRRLNFELSSYTSQQNKSLPMYVMTKDGFTFLAMGFTGKQAAKFKESYINAFNQMEEYIKNQSSYPTLPKRKATGKRVETYLPNQDVLRLQIQAHQEGYQSVYHLLQCLIYDFMNNNSVSYWKKLALESMKDDARNKIYWRDLKIQELEDELVLYKDKYQKSLQFFTKQKPEYSGFIFLIQFSKMLWIRLFLLLLLLEKHFLLPFPKQMDVYL